MKQFIKLSIYIPFLLIMSCSMFFNSDELKDAKDVEESDSGSISLNLTYMSGVLQDFVDSNSRSLLYTTSAVIEIKTYNDENIIDPVPVDLTGTSYSEGTSAELTTINNIPSGTYYYIYVSIYNSAVSTTEPVVKGSKSGVSVSANTTTDVSIVCVPNSATTITSNSVTNDDLVLNEEKWYRVSFTSGYDYEISQSNTNMGTFLYDYNGTLISKIDNATIYTYECTGSGSCYIGVAAPITAGTSTLNVHQVTSHGSVSEPVEVSLDTSRYFRIGQYGSVNQYSYYSFTTNEAGQYFLDLDFDINTLEVFLYSDSGFSTLLTSTTSGRYGMSLGSLSAGTTYYLKLSNTSTTFTDITDGMVVSPTYIADNSCNEGSISSPVSISLGSAYSGSVGTHIFDCNSYYTFTTGTRFSEIVLSRTDYSTSNYIYADIYSDSGYITSVWSESLYGSDKENFVLSPNTQYYLKLNSSSSYYDEKSYSLVIKDFTIPNLSLSTETVGNITTGNTLVYEVDVTAGVKYRIRWDDSYNGTGTYTGDIEVSAYHEDFISSYFVDKDSGYSYVNTATIGAGESTLYIQVAPYHGGSFSIQVYPY